MMEKGNGVFRESGNRLIPNHPAIIMDGNGRWAQARGLPRAATSVFWRMTAL